MGQVEREGIVMPTNNFILGKYDREKFSSKDISPLAMHWEGEGIERPKYGPTGNPIINVNIFSRTAERDETQVVGKLYKGVLEDEEIEGPTLLKRMK